eukprot:1444326-Amphidinium_carterae.1
MAQALNSLKAILTFLEPLALSPFNIKGLAGKFGSGQVSKQSITRVLEFLTGVKGKQEFGKCFPTLQSLADNLSILNKQRGRLVRHLIVLPPTWPSMGIYRLAVSEDGSVLRVLKITTQEEKTITLESVGFVVKQAVLVEENWSESDAHLRQDGNLRQVRLQALFPSVLTFTTPAKKRKAPAMLEGSTEAHAEVENLDAATAANGEEATSDTKHVAKKRSDAAPVAELVDEGKDGDCKMVGVDVPVDLFDSDDAP